MYSGYLSVVGIYVQWISMCSAGVCTVYESLFEPRGMSVHLRMRPVVLACLRGFPTPNGQGFKVLGPGHMVKPTACVDVGCLSNVCF
jgi:hypothetical protein